MTRLDPAAFPPRDAAADRRRLAELAGFCPLFLKDWDYFLKREQTIPQGHGRASHRRRFADDWAHLVTSWAPAHLQVQIDSFTAGQELEPSAPEIVAVFLACRFYLTAAAKPAHGSDLEHGMHLPRIAAGIASDQKLAISGRQRVYRSVPTQCLFVPGMTPRLFWSLMERNEAFSSSLRSEVWVTCLREWVETAGRSVLPCEANHFGTDMSAITVSPEDQVRALSRAPFRDAPPTVVASLMSSASAEVREVVQQFVVPLMAPGESPSQPSRTALSLPDLLRIADAPVDAMDTVDLSDPRPVPADMSWHPAPSGHPHRR